MLKRTGKRLLFISSFFHCNKKNVQIIYLRAQLIGDKMWTLKQMDGNIGSL